MSNCSTKCETGTNQIQKSQSTFRPRVDIMEVDGDLLLVADIPGADQDQTEVSLEKNILTIKGDIPGSTLDGFKMVHREFRTGTFERSFTVSREIDRDSIEASVKDGVLRIRLPKSEEAGMKKITVTTA